MSEMNVNLLSLCNVDITMFICSEQKKDPPLKRLVFHQSHAKFLLKQLLEKCIKTLATD